MPTFPNWELSLLQVFFLLFYCIFSLFLLFHNIFSCFFPRSLLVILLNPCYIETFLTQASQFLQILSLQQLIQSLLISQYFRVSLCQTAYFSQKLIFFSLLVFVVIGLVGIAVAIAYELFDHMECGLVGKELGQRKLGLLDCWLVSERIYQWLHFLETIFHIFKHVMFQVQGTLDVGFSVHTRHSIGINVWF